MFCFSFWWRTTKIWYFGILEIVVDNLHVSLSSQLHTEELTLNFTKFHSSSSQVITGVPIILDPFASQFFSISDFYSPDLDFGNYFCNFSTNELTSD
jgi:dimeric dUTPase (all-alpha-NTP-PPase superfamily)